MSNKEESRENQSSEFISIECPNCGTLLKIGAEWKHVQCKHCGKDFYVDDIADKKESLDAVNLEIKEKKSQTDLRDPIQQNQIETGSEANTKKSIAIDRFKKSRFQKVLLVLGFVFALLAFYFFKRKAILSGLIAVSQTLLAFSSWAMGRGYIQTKKYGWYKVLAIVMFVLIIPCLGAFGRSEDNPISNTNQEVNTNSKSTTPNIIDQNSSKEADISQSQDISSSDSVDSSVVEISEEDEPDLLLEIQRVVGKTLPEAIEVLNNTGFTNVRSNSDSDPKWDEKRWIVSEQSISEGTTLSPDEEILLTCKKLCHVYIDVKSELNAIFSTYAMDIYLDDTQIGTVDNGEYLTKLIDVVEGSHELFAYKADNNTLMGSKKFTVSKDTTIKCEVSHSSSSITYKSWDVVDGVSSSSLEVPSLIGVVLSTAKDQLESIGFVNVHYASSGDNSIWNTNNWTVVSQNIAPGSAVDKNEEILLTCQKTEEYILSLFKDLTINEAEQKASEINLTVTCKNTLTDEAIDFTETDAEYKQKWVVEEASMKSSEDNLVVLQLRFTGEIEVPNLINQPLDEANSTLKSLQMSHVSLQDENGKNVSIGNSWIVLKQSIDEGTVVQADKEIILTCAKYKDLFSEQLVGLTILEANEKTAEYEYVNAYIRHESSTDTVNEEDLTEEEKQFWVVTKLQDINTNKKTVTLNIEYSGNVVVPDLAGMKLDAALKLLESRFFENIVAKYDDKAIPGYSDFSGYMVETQSIDPETTINAKDEIVLICSKVESPVYYSTNGASTVKNGNTGKYAYIREAAEYSMYYIIDFDEGYVYWFSDIDSTCEKVKIDSGTLNDTVIVTYHDGQDVWTNGLHFKYVNGSEHLILQDDDGFLWDYYATDLDRAIKIRDTKRIVEY